MIPLRIALRSRNSLDVINALLREDVEVAKSFGVSGKTCLHLACLYGHDLAVIERLLDVWPEATQWTDRRGLHPLHTACLCDANIAVMERLLAVYPEAASKFDGDEHLLPLHIAAKHCATPECLKMLHDAYPAGIKLKSKEGGKLPLHLAVQNRKVFPKTIAALIELYPDASKEVADDGSLPLHIASQSGCSMAVLKILFEANPHASMEKNKHGETPFKCAEGKQASQRNLMELEERNSAPHTSQAQ